MKRVMVTGGTGFIGYHTVQALLAAGFEVSLLVRSEEKLNKVYGEGVIRHFTCGDIADPDSVQRAMQGCDAVIHVAALVSTRAADAERVYRINLEGTRNVLGGAVDAGVGRVVHVSSVTALYNPKAEILTEESPPSPDARGYGRSKVACEKYARALQDQGAPVTIVYPASVLGPDAPELTEPHVGLQTYLGQFVPQMTSGNQYVDARDIARAHLQILREDTGSQRYILGGHYIPWRELGPILRKLTGRRILEVPLNGAAMRFAGGLAERVAPLLKLDLPLTREGLTYATRWVQMDNSRIISRFGFEFMPVEQSLADSINWLYRAGYISARQAGKLAY